MSPSSDQIAVPLAHVEVKDTTLSDPAAADLIERHRQEVIEPCVAEAGIPPTSETLNVFLLLKLGGRSIACGGLRSLADQQKGMAELKRMYVLPEYRGKANGIADVLIRRLEEHATRHGWTTLRLETGVHMLRARSYYERHGFREIPLFGHYIDDPNSKQSVCYEKLL